MKPGAGFSRRFLRPWIYGSETRFTGRRCRPDYVQEACTRRKSRVRLLDTKLELAERFVAVIESKVGYNSDHGFASLAEVRAIAGGRSPRWPSRADFVTHIARTFAWRRLCLDELASTRAFGHVRCAFCGGSRCFRMLRESDWQPESRAGSIRTGSQASAGRGVQSLHRCSVLVICFWTRWRRCTYPRVCDQRTCRWAKPCRMWWFRCSDRWSPMEVALGYNVWFPPSSSSSARAKTDEIMWRTTRTKGNQLPSHLSHRGKACIPFGGG